MSSKKRIDKILSMVHDLVKEEVGLLVGETISVSNIQQTLTDKEGFFDSLLGKQILAKIDLVGEIEDFGCLCIGIKDAIRLGGTLIMLPHSELEEVVAREAYDGETEDAYGEIANIIAGSYTKVFEESYAKNFRFVRKEQSVLIPVKVEKEGDEPVPDQQYYQVSCTLKLGDVQLGDMHMLMPAVPFGLVEEAPAETAEPEPAAKEEPVAVVTEPEEPVAEEESAQEPAPEEEPVKEVVEEPEPEPVIASEHEAGEESVEEEKTTPKPKRKVDPAAHRKRVDNILAFCESQLSEEITALTGADVKFSGVKNSFISKEDLFFDEFDGKQVMADMEVVGDSNDTSYFFVGLKGAIHIGGVLIMLPESELESFVIDEDFSDDIKDAYGEIANIAAGVYTSAFEEQYIDKIRYIRKELHTIVPMKVDIESDEPIADRLYYMSVMSVAVNGTDLGKVRMVLPADMLQLQDLEQSEAEVEEVKEKKTEPVAASPDSVEEKPVKATTPAKPAGKKQTGDRKKVDKLLKECSKKVQEEISALLGTDIRLNGLKNRFISKEDFFFDELTGKQVKVDLKVEGDTDGQSYLFFSLKDAIYTGGTLIMLPESELENSIAESEFSEDTTDAFGEAANIIAGVYTSVFEKQYFKKIRFVKKDLEQISPMKVEVESEDPVPDVEYYLSSMTLSVGDVEREKIHLLIPADIIGISEQPEEEPAEEVAAERVGTVDQVVHEAVDILVISDDEVESRKLLAGIEARGFKARELSFKDNIKAALTSELKAVYVVIREVDEQAFGMAITVSSASSLPLVAAGPRWTRSKVIKAVKYGVNDILLTPASETDIQESLENNLVKMAA